METSIEARRLASVDWLHCGCLGGPDAPMLSWCADWWSCGMGFREAATPPCTKRVNPHTTRYCTADPDLSRARLLRRPPAIAAASLLSGLALRLLR